MPHLTPFEVDIFLCYGIYCFIMVVFRSMCTVSVFFSVKCASGNYQILKDVINKSQWSQAACFVPLYGDVCNENLRRDQIWKRLLKNLKNQFNDMSLLYIVMLKLHVHVSVFILVQCVLMKQGFFSSLHNGNVFT